MDSKRKDSILNEQTSESSTKNVLKVTRFKTVRGKFQKSISFENFIRVVVFILVLCLGIWGLARYWAKTYTYFSAVPGELYNNTLFLSKFITNGSLTVLFLFALFGADRVMVPILYIIFLPYELYAFALARKNIAYKRGILKVYVFILLIFAEFPIVLKDVWSCIKYRPENWLVLIIFVIFLTKKIIEYSVKKDKLLKEKQFSAINSENIQTQLPQKYVIIDKYVLCSEPANRKTKNRKYYISEIRAINENQKWYVHTEFGQIGRKPEISNQFFETNHYTVHRFHEMIENKKKKGYIEVDAPLTFYI